MGHCRRGKASKVLHGKRRAGCSLRNLGRFKLLTETNHVSSSSNSQPLPFNVSRFCDAVLPEVRHGLNDNYYVWLKNMRASICRIWDGLLLETEEASDDAFMEWVKLCVWRKETANMIFAGLIEAASRLGFDVFRLDQRQIHANDLAIFQSRHEDLMPPQLTLSVVEPAA